jgi:hypothetical protein
MSMSSSVRALASIKGAIRKVTRKATRKLTLVRLATIKKNLILPTSTFTRKLLTSYHLVY